MNLIFRDAVTYDELESFDKISQFKYHRNSPLTAKDKEYSFKTFIDDVNDVLEGKYDSEDAVKYPHTHFTALPFLYKEVKDNQIKYPLYHTADLTSPMQETGLCRRLILTQFFPDIPMDRVEYLVKPGGSLQELIENISNNDYWNGKSIDNAFILSCKGTMFPRNTYVMGVEFNETNQHVLGPWLGKLYDRSDMWYDMKRLILQSDGDYKALLQRLVLDYA